MTSIVSVDIWSDIACPWCFIGKRKFEAGLAGFPNADDVRVTYHSFELAPDTPVEYDGSELDFLTGYKGMSSDAVEQMLSRVGSIAASVGLDYDFDAIRHTKTLHAHEALHFAKAHGRQLALVERFFSAYFEEGRHLGRLGVLSELAGEVGLDADAVRAALDSGEFADDVAADIAQAQSLGISGVPFFVLNGRYGISGAQEPATFTAALEQVASEAAAEAEAGEVAR